MSKDVWSVKDVKDMSHHRLIAFYLMSSFLYYHRNISPLTDDVFDAICKRLLEEYDTIDHQHKKFIDKESLKAGTGYSLKFPTIVEHSALAWWNSMNPIKEEKKEK
jgi:hypothetical protein